MQKLTGSQVRDTFLSFFEQRGHRRVASSSLVPKNDPTLLFTNAGMVQFKDVFTGREARDYRRATTSQKCVRAGGKHNDLDNVGHTARHHTFFEMLGNFSFGDYFKADAIAWAWELVTRELGLDRSRLAVTIFKGEEGIPRDEEARALWKKISGLPDDRILELGKKENFWAMGETGPCGPCSEIHFHQGDDLPCPEKVCLGVACDCDRWLEIWNLVFMQFERAADGKLTPLPRPSIDTGAGLERLAAVVQGVRSNYDTDLLRGLIAAGERLCGKKYGKDEEDDVALRVIADHARATTFLVGDGVLPSNEGRGYVLRRIMRRAIRYGTRLGLDKPFLHEICREVVGGMAGAYPELREHQAFILDVALHEEEAFRRTLDRGLKLIEEEMARARGKRLAGEVVFKLYDTFGFPKDLTEIVAGERGFSIDEAGYEKALAEQQARSEFKGSGEKAVADVYPALRQELGDSEFTGYREVESQGKVRAILVKGRRVAEAKAGDEVELVFDRTPFYGESGGQVGDVGVAEWPGGKAEVQDAQKPVGSLIVHRAAVLSGTLAAGQAVALKVDAERRRRIRANHSATHLLHWALKRVLGEHVKQAGSIVHPDYLRFDYSHFQPPEAEKLAEVERLVNQEVQRNAEAATAELPLEEARKSGAVALFGEKYGDRVRVVQMGPQSRELCGGTHVARTGDVGFFKIQSEGSIASGVRRIVALTGEAAVELVQDEEAQMRRAAELLKASPKELVQRVEGATKRIKELEQSLASEKKRGATASSANLLEGMREVKGVKVLATRADPAEPGAMRELADKLRDKIGSGVVALGGEKEGKALLLVAVTKDLTGRYRAGDLVRELAKEVGGSGGGKPDMAQAGGPDAQKLGRALERLYELI
ncbi:MAG TPA: alanine--tRNA ligase [Myxococcales bacterium]|nr:alanine--tRNA ligase [Myxococcales bacterium]